jgi:hypothetical protein
MVSMSAELCQGLSRGFNADYIAAIQACERTLEIGLRTKAALNGQSEQVSSAVFVCIMGRAEYGTVL